MSKEPVNPTVNLAFYDADGMTKFMKDVWDVATKLDDGSMLAGAGAAALFQAYSEYELDGLGMNRPDAKSKNVPKNHRS